MMTITLYLICSSPIPPQQASMVKFIGSQCGFIFRGPKLSILISIKSATDPNPSVFREQPCVKSSDIFLQEKEVKPLAKSSPDEERSHALEVGEFCRLFRNHMRDGRICLKVQDEELFQLHHTEAIDQHPIYIPWISLTTVLETRKLSSKMSLLLSYTLAQSFLKLYHSTWMTVKCTTDSIYFTEKRTTGDTVDTNKPQSYYFSEPGFAFQMDAFGSFPEYDNSLFAVHPNRHILSLGLLLVEVAMGPGGTRIKSQAQSLPANVNSDFMMGLEMLHGLERGRYLSPRLLKAIRNCFDLNAFHATQGFDESRIWLYMEVVLPLQTLVEENGWTDSMLEV
jgi:hypothetical protein